MRILTVTKERKKCHEFGSETTDLSLFKRRLYIRRGLVNKCCQTSWKSLKSWQTLL